MNASTLFAALASLAFAGSTFAAVTPASDAAAAAQAAVAAQAIAAKAISGEKSAQPGEEKRKGNDANDTRRATEASQFDWIMR